MGRLPIDQAAGGNLGVMVVELNHQTAAALQQMRDDPADLCGVHSAVHSEESEDEGEERRRRQLLWMVADTDDVF